jgi:hypothetical protein
MSRPEILDALRTERVAYWFFRLNGCLQIENFILHPDANVDPANNQQRTDADIMGVRFHHRNELDMKDCPLMSDDKQRTVAFIAEIKKGGVCRLNGPWTNPQEGNLNRVLSSMGIFQPGEIHAAADKLYKEEIYSNDQVVFRMVAIAATENEVYSKTKRNVIQIPWSSALAFIHGRFREFRIQKQNHGQWDSTGITLWELSETTHVDRFINNVVTRFL